jgi:hypothetical protein
MPVGTWKLLNETLYCSGTPLELARAYTTSVPLDLTGQTQFEFDLTVDISGCGGTLTFYPYDGSWHTEQPVTLTRGASTVTLSFSLWPTFTPSSFSGYSFNFSGGTGYSHYFYVDNLRATPEIATVLLYALGLMLCGVYLRTRH